MVMSGKSLIVEPKDSKLWKRILMHLVTRQMLKGSIVKLCFCSNSNTRISLTLKKSLKPIMTKIYTWFFNIWMLTFTLLFVKAIFYRKNTKNTSSTKLPNPFFICIILISSIEISSHLMFSLTKNAMQNFVILD